MSALSRLVTRPKVIRDILLRHKMMEKITIKGEGAHPVYVWLKNKSNNGVADHSVRWNFHKFLVDEAGSLIGSFKSGVDPMDNQILSLVKEKNK